MHVTGKQGAYNVQRPFRLSVVTDPSVCDPVNAIGTGPAPGSAGSTARAVATSTARAAIPERSQYAGKSAM